MEDKLLINYQALATMKADPEEIFLVTCLNNKKNRNIETYKKTLPQLIDWLGPDALAFMNTGKNHRFGLRTIHIEKIRKV